MDIAREEGIRTCLACLQIHETVLGGQSCSRPETPFLKDVCIMVYNLRRTDLVATFSSRPTFPGSDLTEEAYFRWLLHRFIPGDQDGPTNALAVAVWALFYSYQRKDSTNGKEWAEILKCV